MKLLFVLGVLGFASLIACASSDDDTSPLPGSDAGTGAEAAPANCAAEIAAPVNREGACTGTWSTPGRQQPENQHVKEGTPLQFCSNPPSSGPHYSSWADFKEYDKEVPWGYLVHSMEHGGVLLLYKCDGACPEIVEALRAVRDRAPADTTCERQSRAGTKRIIIAPSSTIPSKVAAAAWGQTFTADCVDGPTLDEFVAKRGGLTTTPTPPEDLCFAGQIAF